MNGAVIREHGPSILVALLSSAFGVALLQTTTALALVVGADPATGDSGQVALMLGVLAGVFIVIALYVGSVVTSNTFATIIAGRTKTIALMRLIGSTASAQRRAVAREGLLIGVIGAGLGALVGTAVAAAMFSLLVWMDILPALGFNYLQPIAVLPAVAVILTTWLASWTGSRKVLVVAPVQAIGAAQELSHEETTGRRGRNAFAIALFLCGIGTVLLGVAVGFITPAGVLIGVVGGVLSFTGLMLGAHLVMPPVLRLVGRAFGASPSARLAAQNAVRYPERSSRNTIGLVIGVTLVTMFAVAIRSFETMLRRSAEGNPESLAGIETVMMIAVAVMSILTGFSAVIAAVGMVNNLSLSVLQRTRELGLLRALGFTASQVRRMILAESAQLTFAAVLVGLLLGTFYGWAGAQALLGSSLGSPTLMVPGIPVTILVIIVGGAALLTWVASVAPARRATTIAPVTALAVQ